jgi:hypothetical protein
VIKLAVWTAARRLDRVAPGWYNKVDTTILDLRSDSRCVLGQVYGSFTQAPERLYQLTRSLDPTPSESIHALYMLLTRLPRDMLAFMTQRARPYWVKAIARRKLRDEYRELKELMKNDVQEDTAPVHSRPASEAQQPRNAHY